MENYGLTLKKVRESLNISQHNVSNGIMSQSNYSKVENGEIDIPFTKMVDLMNQLGMTIDEFLYIHRDYKKNPGKQLSRLSRLKPGDKMTIVENINDLKAIENPSQREHEILAIFEALYLISNDNYKAANEKVSMIWQRLEKYDTWYLYDIRLINSILYMFPIDVAQSIVTLVLKRLETYKKLVNTSKLSANLQINYVLLLIQNKKYRSALNRIENIITFCIDNNLYTHLGTCYIRKGILLNILNNKNPSSWYEKGFELLRATNNDGLVQELKKEINLYTDAQNSRF